MAIFFSPMTGKKFYRNAPAPMPQIDKSEYQDHFIDPKIKIRAHLKKCVENDSPRDYLPLHAAERILPYIAKHYIKNSVILSRGEMNMEVTDDTQDWKLAGRIHALRHYLEPLKSSKTPDDFDPKTGRRFKSKVVPKEKKKNRRKVQKKTGDCA